MVGERRLKEEGVTVPDSRPGFPSRIPVDKKRTAVLRTQMRSVTELLANTRLGDARRRRRAAKKEKKVRDGLVRRRLATDLSLSIPCLASIAGRCRPMWVISLKSRARKISKQGFWVA